ncbi:MAG: hypothetical protein GX605_06730 [Chloroflexi bacterium]|nr:hypothetical protein [Chloroflexota bacterium]
MRRDGAGGGRFHPDERTAVVCAVLLAAAAAGRRPSEYLLGAAIVGLAALIIIRWPSARIPSLILAALVMPLQFYVGRSVALNPAMLILSGLAALWLVEMLISRHVALTPSRLNRPLALFVALGPLSLGIGLATWDPAVARPAGFIVVQFAQWAVFALSALALWLTAGLLTDERQLARPTFFFLGLAGTLAILQALPATRPLVARLATLAVDRAPFWLLLTGLAGGQLLFNPKLSKGWKRFLLVALGAVVFYSFFLRRSSASTWLSVAAAATVLAWLRWPRVRWFAVAVLAVLLVVGVAGSALYSFAGGEAEWEESGGSRLALSGRVVEVTLRNPITGLGPAAYRPYAGARPLVYGGAYYAVPLVSSHNNYVDIFSHVGIVGLGVFVWFAAEVVRSCQRLHRRIAPGFSAGYLHGMLATWTGCLVLMMFADWLLPFVYNIGLPGFQASVLVWLFLGGLVVLENAVPTKA